MSLINHLGDSVLDNIPGVEDAQRGETARVRELHFGLGNLMPDTAYFQTIKDWAQLINLADQSLQIHLHYLNLDGITREGAAKEHADKFGKNVGEVLERGLDGIIVTGANTEHDYPNLSEVPYIKDFEKLVEGIENGPVTSGIFACFAFHVLMETKFRIRRNLYIPGKDEKVWGVHPHEVPASSRNHFLTRGGDTHFEAVSSRWGDLEASHVEAAGFMVLNQASTTRNSVGAATDPKMNYLGLQTHSEYDSLGLVKEYLRDWNLFCRGEISEPNKPTFLTEKGNDLLAEITNQGEINPDRRKTFYPIIEPEVRVSWKAPGTALIHRWVSGVLKLTSYERSEKYMKGVNPEDPMSFLQR